MWFLIVWVKRLTSFLLSRLVTGWEWVVSTLGNKVKVPLGGNAFNSAGVMQGLGCHAAMPPETAKASCHHAASWLADVSEHAGVAGNAT